MIKQKLEADLKQIVETLGLKVTDPLLSISQNPAFGTYTSNIALQQANLKSENGKQTPLETANQILSNLKNLSYLSKAEVAGPGFINFFIKDEVLAAEIAEILAQTDNWGKSSKFTGKIARVEFVSANPTGPLQIGNGRGGPLGDVIANVLASQGYEVLREYLDNDVGNQVAILGSTIKAILSGKKLKKEHYQGEYVKQLTQSLKGKVEDKTDEQVGEMAVKLNFEDIMKDTIRLGLKFDLIIHESQLRERAQNVVERLRESGVVKEKDNALWLAPSDEFLKDRETVIVKSDGNYTYFTSDIVYHQDKFESGADLIINVLGADHHGHVPRLQAAISALGYDTNKFKPIVYQYVRIRKGDEVVKLSKRAGNLITVREILDEVGVDAFRFTMLLYGTQTHIDFDLNLVKEQSNKNPVYFVQYAHARMFGILSKANYQHIGSPSEAKFLDKRQEIELVKHLLQLPDLLLELAENFQVHQLTTYAITLADLFHKFYEVCPVLTAESTDLKQSRLSLVKASQITLQKTLSLLGVTAPNRM